MHSLRDRAGQPLFDNLFGSDTLIHKQIVETLGRVSKAMVWAERRTWFDEAQERQKPADEQRTLFPAVQGSIRQKLRRNPGTRTMFRM